MGIMELVPCNVRPVQIGVVHALKGDGMTLCGIRHKVGLGWVSTTTEVTCAMCLASMNHKPVLVACGTPVSPEIERAMVAEELAESLVKENSRLRNELGRQIRELNSRISELERRVMNGTSSVK
jgi:hypothetical protein